MKFKCKLSGLVYEFAEWDVEGMKKHPDYEIVEETKEAEEVSKRGRPAKKLEEINE